MSAGARMKVRLLRLWKDYLRPIAFVVVVLTAFRSSIADWNDVPSGSMRPSILEGDRIFVNKLAYDLKFTVGGIRRQVIRCTAVRHQCEDCRMGFLPELYKRLDKH